MDEDHHAVLGIRTDASREEVLQAYSELVKKFHPDHNHDDPDAEKKFMQIQRSFEMLYEPERHQVVGAFHTRLSAFMRVQCLGRSTERPAYSSDFLWPLIAVATVFYLVLLVAMLIMSLQSGFERQQTGSPEGLGAVPLVIGISLVYIVAVVTVVLLKVRR